MGRRIRWIVGASFAACVGALIVWPVLHPSEDIPVAANAVVVFAGGQGERLDRAHELMDAGVASVLVLNTGSDRWNDEAYDAQVAMCDDSTISFEVICVSAETDSTKGEAQRFAQIADQHAWTSMIAVTDDYHLSRASRWLGRCFDGTVYRASATGDQGISIRLREFAATVAMWTIDRSCPDR